MRIRAPFLVTNSLHPFQFHTLRLLSGLGLLSAVLVGYSGSAARADAQAQDILKKMSAVYDVNTFQGKVTLNQTGTTEENKPFNISSVEEVTFKKPNLFYIKNSGPGVGGTQISAFNGKEEINYVSAQNRYTKLPPNGAAGANLSLLALLGVRFDVPSGKVVNSTTMAGKAAYVVQVLPPVPPLPANASTDIKKQQEQLKKMLVPYELVIDKKDYHLLRVTQHTPAIKMSKTMDITQQTLNSAIVDSAFAFTPPPGARQVNWKAPDPKNFKRLNVNTGGLNPGGTNTRVSRGTGSPVPAPHASPGANGSASKQ